MKAKKTWGFTIVELLTVMAVIAVLIGLLIPALGLVKDHAKEIQQKAQFHGIDVGLEMFKNLFGDYPESFDNSFDTPVAPLTADPQDYCGSEKLAEALVGWDLLGFHRKSGFRSDGTNYFPPSGGFAGGYQLVYDTTNGLQVGSYTEVDGAANIKAREDEMIELEHANAFKIRDIYNNTYGNFNPDNFVLCDAFAKKRMSAAKTGMPILYFKARTNYQFQDWTDANVTDDDIYNYFDNSNLVALGMAEANNPVHELLTVPADTLLKFENMILNTQVQQATAVGGNPGVKRPYKADSYILISAGKDGSYGTADDLFNFDKGVSE